jgi:DNA replication protein DnaC
MRTEQEITADLDAIGKPSIRIGFMKDQRAMEAAAKWCAENPEKSARYDELVGELQALDEAARKENQRRQYIARLRDDGLGERLIEAAWGDALQPTPAVMAARDWAASGKTWLVLSGNVGTGKSVAAAMALIEEIKRGPGAVFLGDKARGTIAFRRASALVRMSAYDEGAKELARLKSIAMLVVDDLGTEHSTSWGTSLIHEIFDTRHDDRLRTIITTNIGRETLKAAIGDRLADRIAQDGKVVYLEGKSMRRP